MLDVVLDEVDELDDIYCVMSYILLIILAQFWYELDEARDEMLDDVTDEVQNFEYMYRIDDEAELYDDHIIDYNLDALDEVDDDELDIQIIEPGFVDSDIIDEVDEVDEPEQLEIEPDEIDYVIVFLVSVYGLLLDDELLMTQERLEVLHIVDEIDDDDIDVLVQYDEMQQHIEVDDELDEIKAIDVVIDDDADVNE